jgi:hypothetical protein
MALANYTDLQAAIASWNFARTDLPTADIILLAENRLNTDLRVSQQQGTSTATISDEYSAVPSDFFEAISFVVDDKAITAVPQTAIDAQASSTTNTGSPDFYAIVGSQFRFYPVPDTDYDAVLTYWKKIPALTDSNTTNWLLTAWPAAYLAACNVEAALWTNDDAQAQRWEARYQAAIAPIVRQDARNRRTPLRCESILTASGGFNYNPGQ